MYVRRKDIDMVATSDSNPTGSASNDEADAPARDDASTGPAADADPAAPPESSAPESSAPESDAPESDAAESDAPESAAPESDAPGTTEPPSASTSSPAVATRSPAESPSTEGRRREPDSPKRTRVRRDRPVVSRDQVRGAVNGVRERLAAIVWIITVVFAVILVGGALLIALEANPNNELVEQVKDWAADLDGPFSDLFTFDGDNAVKKAALVNWGLAAAAWLVGGKIVSSIIRP